MERIWRQEGLKVPQEQPKRWRLWLNDGSCIRLRPERKNYGWSYDFVHDRTHDGRALRMLTIIVEYTRESLVIDVARRFSYEDVLYRLAMLFIERGVPQPIRSDNGPEFTAKIVMRWLDNASLDALLIKPASPWENGHIESFNGKLCDELLDGEIFYTMEEARALIEACRWEYNTIRPHGSLGYRPPAPKASGYSDPAIAKLQMGRNGVSPISGLT